MVLMQDESTVSSHLPHSPLTEFELGLTAFDNYLILGKVGAGGMGVVYRVTNLILNRTEALKVLPMDTLSAGDTVRFQNEARMLSRLEHANLARVFDFGIGDGCRPYLSMEFVEGDTLQEFVEKNGALPLDLFYEMMIQICKGLAHAHERGIIHRDVKSNNIILSSDDHQSLRAVLIDFGVAKMTNDEASDGRVTKTGAMVGSPLYISPEQIVGKAASEASDVYSLCCVMFFALTGEPPYSAPTMLETLLLHREAVLPLEKLKGVKGISPELCELIEKGLSKQPEHRQKQLIEIADKLNDLAAKYADTESGAANDTESEPGVKTSSKDSAEKASLVLSERAAKLLSEAATQELSIKSSPENLGRFFYGSITAVLVLATVIVVLFLFPASREPELSSQSPTNADVRITPLSSTSDVERKRFRNDRRVSKIEDDVEENFNKFLDGKVDKPIYKQMLNEANRAKANPRVKNAELYMALENYNKCIELRKADGPDVKPPNNTITNALIGIYDVNLQLQRFNELPALEQEIIKWCPEGNTALAAHDYFQKAADICGRKRKKVDESVRCMVAAAAVYPKFDKANKLGIAHLDLNIGSTYLVLGDFPNAKTWLEKARAGYESVKPVHPFLFATFVRLGHTYRELNDYKTAVSRLRAAEKLASKSSKLVDETQVGQMYYSWAVVLFRMAKYEECEEKLLKVLSTNSPAVYPPANKLLLQVRKKLGHSSQGAVPR
jgi:serine/threonine protein kinase